MEMRIVWTDKAKFHLKLIHLFYLENVSFKVAESQEVIISVIFDCRRNPESLKVD